MQGVVSQRKEPKKRSAGGNKDLANLTEASKRALILEALEAKGYRHTDAAALLNVQRAQIATISKIRTEGLLAPLASLYRRNLKTLAKGQLVGAMAEIKGSDVLGALKEIGARIDPIVNKQEIKSTHLNIDITSEDRARIMATLGIAHNIGNVPEAEIVADSVMCISQKE